MKDYYPVSGPLLRTHFVLSTMIQVFLFLEKLVEKEIIMFDNVSDSRFNIIEDQDELSQ